MEDGGRSRHLAALFQLERLQVVGIQGAYVGQGRPSFLDCARLDRSGRPSQRGDYLRHRLTR